MHCVVCLIFTVKPLEIHKYLQMFHSSFTICFIGFKLLMKYIFDYEFSTGHNFNERNEQIDTKSGQWFGATVASAGIDGPLVVSFYYFYDYCYIDFNIDILIFILHPQHYKVSETALQTNKSHLITIYKNIYFMFLKWRQLKRAIN